MSTTTEPKLAAPGAGLPAIEHLIARILFGLRRSIGSRDGFTAKFTAERAAIRAPDRTSRRDASPGARRARLT